jgi:aryl-alcohol dehydrogenase-like predicted oxidoreductase
MGMSGMYGPADRAESIGTVHAALDAGITLLDTGDFYGMGHKGSDFRAHSPRFQGENLARNLALAEALRRVAAARGATPAQLAIAWVLSRGTDVVPLVGGRTRARLQEALGALTVSLSPEDLAAIEDAVPAGAAAGARYPDQQLAHLESEKQT